MTELDRWSAVWAHCAWVDAWQGTLLALVVWLVCRIWSGMPARGRAWLWWCVAVKFILGFIPMAGIPLPILPSHAAHIALAGIHIPARIAVGPNVGVECTTAACASYVGSPEFVQCIHTVGVMFRCLLLGLWIFGITVNFRKMAHGWFHANELRQRAQTVQHPAISFECRRLCFFVGIRPPLLLGSDELTSPVLTGFFKPAIILPSDIIVDCKVHDARMMLAHELGHLKRRDLLLGWVPAIAQLLNWWNPMLWLMAREWGVSQEIACDEFAVETTAALPAHFGKMLLAMAMASRRPGPVGVAAVGLAGGEHQALKKRLIGMRNIGAWARPGVNVSMRAVICAVSFLMIPWRPVPTDEFHLPRVHSAAAVAAWSEIVWMTQAVDRGAGRVVSLCTNAMATSSSPVHLFFVPQNLFPSTTNRQGTDTTDWDFHNAGGLADLRLGQDHKIVSDTTPNSGESFAPESTGDNGFDATAQAQPVSPFGRPLPLPLTGKMAEHAKQTSTAVLANANTAAF